MSYHSHLFTAHRHVNITCRLHRSLFLAPRSIKICHIYSHVLFMLHNISICYSILEGHMIKYNLLFTFLKIVLTFPVYQKCERSSRIWEITVFHVWTILCFFLGGGRGGVLYPISKWGGKSTVNFQIFVPPLARLWSRLAANLLVPCSGLCLDLQFCLIVKDCLCPKCWFLVFYSSQAGRHEDGQKK